LGKDPELRISKTGTKFTNMGIAVAAGRSDDGKEINQWLRATCFGEVAEWIASRAKKGDRVYVEGQLTLSTWVDKATGEAKTGLNVTAWKCEKVPGIGKNRPPRTNESNSPYRHQKPAQADQFGDSLEGIF
jgi:single stranded DNA-binding protein